MYSSKQIYNMCQIVHKTFNNKIVCCGGLADFFHLDNIKYIKDFDFYISMSDLITAINLSKNIVEDLLDKQKQFVIELGDLRLRKYSPFLPNHIACLQGYLRIKTILYFIDVFVIEDINSNRSKKYNQKEYIFNIQTIQSRINTIKYIMSLRDNQYISTRAGSSTWLENKQNKFPVLINKYKKKYGIETEKDCDFSSEMG
jgi:hypothetical protein